jgi:hypothetical protein
MSTGAQLKVEVFFHDGSKTEFRYVQGMQFTEFGSMELIRPRDIAGTVLIPWVTPGSLVKYAVITEESIKQVSAITNPGRTEPRAA